MALLDPYSKLRSPFQAGEVSHLVRVNEAWLAEARPQTVARNHDYREAFKSIWRACNDPAIRNFVLRHPEGYVNGLGSVTLHQTVHHESIGDITGNQIDMWFAPNTSIDTQTLVVRSLYDVAKGRNNTPVFGALTAQEQERAEGMDKVLRRVGQPGEISTPYGDPFGILAGDPVQLYVES